MYEEKCETSEENVCTTVNEQVAILILSIILLNLLVFSFLRFATLFTSSNVKRFIRMSVR